MTILLKSQALDNAGDDVFAAGAAPIELPSPRVVAFEEWMFRIRTRGCDVRAGTLRMTSYRGLLLLEIDTLDRDEQGRISTVLALITEDQYDSTTDAELAALLIDGAAAVTRHVDREAVLADLSMWRPRYDHPLRRLLRRSTRLIQRLLGLRPHYEWQKDVAAGDPGTTGSGQMLP